MPPCSNLTCSKSALFYFLITFYLFLQATSVSAQNQPTEYFNANPGKPFVIALGAGYGISNNPCVNCNDEKTLHGITLSGSLGYRLGKRFKIDFGPVVWIKSEDLFQNDLPAGERTSGKRMLVSFNGYYQLHKRVPLTLKLGAGIGSMVYSPERSTVSADGKKNNPTEYFSGPAGTASLIYELHLTEKITIHPTLNFWYTDLKKQQIDYVSAVDHRQPSITSDLRIQLYLTF